MTQHFAGLFFGLVDKKKFCIGPSVFCPHKQQTPPSHNEKEAFIIYN
jgi:hypothetical protein